MRTETKTAMGSFSQSEVRARNPFASAFGISSLALILTLALLSHVLGLSLAIFALLIGTLALLWIVVRHPVSGLGAFLAFMPIFPMALLLGSSLDLHTSH